MVCRNPGVLVNGSDWEGEKNKAKKSYIFFDTESIYQGIDDNHDPEKISSVCYFLWKRCDNIGLIKTEQIGQA